MTSLQKHIVVLVCIIFAFAICSCETEEDFGFPSKINMSGNGETIEIKGSNEASPGIIQIQVLNYNGDGNSSGLLTEGKDYMETTTDWLTVKYSNAEYKLVLIARPNESNKNRKLYLYMLSGNSRQEITVSQSKQQ